MASRPDTWDEHDWERFLQVQDRATSYYLDLVDRYQGHAQADALIAQEMGWSHLGAAIEHLEEELACEEGPCEGEDCSCSLDSVLYSQNEELHRCVGSLFEAEPGFESDQDAVALATNCAILTAKIAAGMAGGDQDEIGLAIAYMKRAAKAANEALAALSRLASAAKIPATQEKEIRDCLFAVRDTVVRLMGDLRSEWLRRLR